MERRKALCTGEVDKDQQWEGDAIISHQKTRSDEERPVFQGAHFSVA